ncbi:MAG: PDZ domain-containing protein [Acidobacteriota bacterium]
MKMQSRLAVVAAGLSLMLPAWAQSRQSVEVYVGGGGYLGVELRDVTSDDVASQKLDREAGVYIEDVRSGTPAEESDLRAGDIILEFSGLPVLSVRQFQRLVQDSPAGRTVELVLQRNNQKITKTIEVGHYPRFRGGHPRWFAGRIPEMDIEIPELEVLPEGRGNGFVFSTGRLRLGIRGESLTQQMAEFLGVPGGEGILVMEVMEGTPAASADLKAGDVIVSIDGKDVGEIRELSKKLSSGPHKLEIVRDKKERTVAVEIRKKEKQRKGRSVRL